MSMVVYQVLPRLFGNRTRTRQYDGDKGTNGCGRFADFTPSVLKEIRELGVTHVWYTGILEHATQTDYAAYGIQRDHPSVVKGKAGSPYAVKDYYDVDPDLATSVNKRMEEFEQLIRRTHRAGLRAIMDFIPNHVARQYGSDACPQGVKDLGADDDRTVGFSPRNNFYYIDAELTLDSYHEYPAKATGNDVFSSCPTHNDWYETVKLNYGVDVCGGRIGHFDPVPDTWVKMRDILRFWTAKGVDGFRCDMAEMVPVEFWHWVIPQIKELNRAVIFIAEVYNPVMYRSYLHDGHFDFLYDKVGLYDTLRNVVCGRASAQEITGCWQQVDDIRNNMLYFLENHDEQRLASDFYAGDALRGKAPLLVSCLMGQNPVMIYFGQELGERGMEAEGFSGRDGRTSIFDYGHVECIQRWLHDGKPDEQALTPVERDLRNFYRTVLRLCRDNAVVSQGSFYDLMYANPQLTRQYVFLRAFGGNVILVAANFDAQDVRMQINIPAHAAQFLGMTQGQESVRGVDLLTGETQQLNFGADEKCEIVVKGSSGVALSFKISVKCC